MDRAPRFPEDYLSMWRAMRVNVLGQVEPEMQELLTEFHKVFVNGDARFIRLSLAATEHLHFYLGGQTEHSSRPSCIDNGLQGA